MQHNWSNLTNYIKSGYRSNAYAPFVWAVGLIAPFLLTIFILSTDIYIRYVLVGLFVVIVIFALVMYLVLVMKDPRLLQSENYRLEDKKLDMITQKGSDFEIKPLELVTPTVNLLEEGKENE